MCLQGLTAGRDEMKKNNPHLGTVQDGGSEILAAALEQSVPVNLPSTYFFLCLIIMLSVGINFLTWLLLLLFLVLLEWSA